MTSIVKPSFTCPICCKTMNEKRKMAHLQIHTVGKPFKCQYCNKGFDQNVKVKNHERIHTGERPFQCPQCPKRFNSYWNLRRHISDIHSECRSFSCNFCPKKFKQSDHLKTHIGRYHSSMKDLNHQQQQDHQGFIPKVDENANPERTLYPTVSSTNEAMREDPVAAPVSFEMYGQKFLATPHPTKRWTVAMMAAEVTD